MGSAACLTSGTLGFSPQNGLLASITGVEARPNMFLGGGVAVIGTMAVELAKKLGTEEVGLGGSWMGSFAAGTACTGGVLNEKAEAAGAGAGVGVAAVGAELGGEGAAERSGDAVGLANENGKEVSGGSLASDDKEGGATGGISLGKEKLVGMLNRGAFCAASSSILYSFWRSPSSSSIPSSSS